MKPSKQQEPRIAVRVTSDLKARLEEAQKITGLDEPVIVRNAVEAFVAYVEQFKESPPFPLEFRKPGQQQGQLSPQQVQAMEAKLEQARYNIPRNELHEVIHVTPAKKAKAKQSGEGRG